MTLALSSSYSFVWHSGRTLDVSKLYSLALLSRKIGERERKKGGYISSGKECVILDAFLLDHTIIYPIIFK